MTERADKRGSAAPVAVLVMLFILPFAYVLSIGPVNWLVTNDYVDSDRVRWFYLPLIHLAENSDAVGQVFVWYMSMFGDV